MKFRDTGFDGWYVINDDNVDDFLNSLKDVSDDSVIIDCQYSTVYVAGRIFYSALIAYKKKQ